MISSDYPLREGTEYTSDNNREKTQTGQTDKNHREPRDTRSRRRRGNRTGEKRETVPEDIAGTDVSDNGAVLCL